MWTIILLALVFKSYGADIMTSSPTPNRTNDLVRHVECQTNQVTWENAMCQIHSTINKLERLVKPQLESLLSSSNVSEACSKSLFVYLDGVKKWETWAVRMTDANGRIPSGLLTGTKMSFGAFEECLDVSAPSGKGGESFRGQYCMVGLKSTLLSPLKSVTADGKSYVEAYGYPPYWISDIFETEKNLMRSAGVWVGHCIPSTCTEQDIRNFYGFVFKPWVSDVTVTDCQTNDSKEYTNHAKTAKYAFLILAAVCILGTCLDLGDSETSNDNCSLVKRLLFCFSMKRNAKKLIEIHEKDRTPLNALHGVRFFLSIVIVVEHVIIYMDHYREMRYTDSFGFIDIYSRPIFAHLVNGPLLMENFFVMSGLLLGAVFGKQLVLYGGKFNFKEFFLRMFFRIIPTFVFTLLLLFFLPTVDRGPIWNSTWDREVATCEESWWRNLLFIQNLWHLEELCLLHTWFIGCLMQTQIAGILIFIIFCRNPKAGVLVSAVLCVFCICVDYNIASSYKFPMLTQESLKDIRLVEDYLSYIYLKPFNHIPSILIGIGLAVILFTHGNKEFSKNFYTIGWITLIVISQILIFFIYIPDLDTSIVALYYAVRNIFWSLSLSWTIFACFRGYGGFLNSLLSFDTFIPLNRISFCIYLLHPLVILYRAAIAKSTRDLDAFSLVFEVAGIFVFTVLLSVVAYICVELPSANLYNSFFKAGPKQRGDSLLEDQQCNQNEREKLKCI